MNQLNFYGFALACALLSPGAFAHIGLVNVTTPISGAGQGAFALANTTNELVFNVPHGCVGNESVPAFTGANLDTYKIEITVPAAIVAATTPASLRPVMSGVFGAVSVGAVDGAGQVKLTWVKKMAAVDEPHHTDTDNHVYQLGLRLKTPAPTSASDVSIKRYAFLAVQTCKNAANQDVVMDWGVANSPKLTVFPDKRKGFNKFTLDASALPDFRSAATLAGPLKSYFGDAAIVWVNKAGYSPNPTTLAQIVKGYGDLGVQEGASWTGSETIWVKY